MKKLLILPVLALAACSQSEPSAPNVAGTWTGTLLAAGTQSDPYTLQITQQAGSDDFTGTLVGGQDSGTVSGKVSSGVMNYVGNNGYNAVFTGTFSGNTYKGSYTITNLNEGGSFSFTKNQ